MNSRERMLTALRHQEPDRVPIDFGGGPTGNLDIWRTTNWSACEDIATNDAVGPPANCWTNIADAISP